MARQCRDVSLASEVVLRGGYLKDPAVLTRLRVVEGRHFLPLWKSCPVLNKFLTGQPSCRRPLAKSMVFEAVTDAKNKAWEEEIAALRTGEVPQPTDDLVSALDLGDEQASALPSGQRRRKRPLSQRALRHQVPNISRLSLVREGKAVWEPCVVMDQPTKAASLEMTADNLRTLLEWVGDDRAEGEVKRERFGTGVTRTERQHPRVTPTAREYFVRGRWVKKLRKATDSAATPLGIADVEPSGCLAERPSGSDVRRPYVADFRTLVRQRSDEDPVAKRRKRAKRARAHEDDLDPLCYDASDDVGLGTQPLGDQETALGALLDF